MKSSHSIIQVGKPGNKNALKCSLLVKKPSLQSGLKWKSDSNLLLQGKKPPQRIFE